MSVPTKTPYRVLEPAVGLLGLTASAPLAALDLRPLELPVPDLFKWAGVALLAQGLIRDLVLVAGHRRRLQSGPKPASTGLWLCLESTLGAGLVAIFLLLLLLGAEGSVVLSVPVVTLLLSAWWLFGWATRDLVLELKRDPDHLNLLVGFKPK